MATFTHEECRAVLHYLESADDDVVSLDDLVDHAVTQGTDDRERIAIALHHNVLPKLDDVGILEYDALNHTVRYWGSPVLERYLNLVAETNTVAEYSSNGSA